MPKKDKLQLNQLNNEPEDQTFLVKLSKWADRHSNLIIFISGALILAIVIIFAQYFYAKSQTSRAEDDLADVLKLEDIDTVIGKLERLKKHYKKSPVLPKILYHLANKYYEANRLNEAKLEYENFKNKFTSHPLSLYVDKAYNSLLKDIEWKKDSDKLITVLKLKTHPLEREKGNGLPYHISPLQEPLSKIKIITTKGDIIAKLFDDEAVATVKNFLKLTEENFYDDCKCIVVDDGNAIIFDSKKKYNITMPSETTSRDALKGSLIITHDEKGIYKFKILLKDALELERGAVIFGIVEEGIEKLQSVTKDDTVKKIVILISRNQKDNKQHIPR